MAIGPVALVYLEFSVKVLVSSFVVPLLVLWIVAEGPVQS